MAATSPAPQADPPMRVIDERPRSYTLRTPRGTAVAVDLGGPVDPVHIRLALARAIDISLGMNTGQMVELSLEEAWATWALLTDALAGAGEMPDWVNTLAGPIGPDGTPLLPLPGMPGAEPF